MTDKLKGVFTSAILEYQEKGLNFTMESLSKRMGISKKTLYQLVKSKEEVIGLLINQARDSIKEKQRAILENDSIDVVEKIRCILTVVPEFHNVFSYRKLLEIKLTYPILYKKLVDMLNDDWEPTFNLFNQGVMENKIKKVNINLFKEMYIAALTSIYNKDLMTAGDISYKELLSDIISILVDGIIK